MERLVFPSWSSKILRPAHFSASQSASAWVSSLPTPTRMTNPRGISARVSSPTRTLPQPTRCSTIRTVHPRPSGRSRLAADQPGDLAGVGVAPRLKFGVNQSTIDGDLETAPVGGDEADALDAEFELLQEFRHQTDGSIGVVSNSTVFDGDVHHSRLSTLSISHRAVSVLPDERTIKQRLPHGTGPAFQPEVDIKREMGGSRASAHLHFDDSPSPGN